MVLHIASPNEKRDVKIVWIELNTPVGNFVIQRQHAPMVVTLSPLSSVTYRTQGDKEESFKVVNGVAHVTREEVTLLLAD